MKNPEVERRRNTDRLREFFLELCAGEGERGVIGVAGLSDVHDELMPRQRERLESLVRSSLRQLQDGGSIACIGIAYRDPVIDYIDRESDGLTDFDAWNHYAAEYDRLNQVLDRMAKQIADRFDGIALTATISGIADKVGHVKDYFDMVVSHRVVAENAGIGWRGKNQLIVNEKYSCAIRFASVILSLPLTHGSKMESRCGSCTACEDACSFIRNRDVLPDYRENCRRYILFLGSKGITRDVCGKCIKACYRNGLLSGEFSLG